MWRGCFLCTNGLETATYLDQARFDAATAALEAAVKKREEMLNIDALTDQKTAIKRLRFPRKRQTGIANPNVTKANAHVDAAMTVLV